MRICIVGGGILGLATARVLVRERTDASVILLEKEPQVAMHQTGRNSGVVHAGLYYKPGSLKARLCRRGVGLLKAYCAEHGIAYEECGKVLVATNAVDLGRLEAIEERAHANGVPGVKRLSQPELRAVEPHVRGLAALHSPTTAIADFAGVARQMARDIVAGGGEVRCGAEVVRVPTEPKPRVELRNGDAIEADHVVVCAGLQVDQLARASGEHADPRILPVRGEFWALRPERTDLVRGLVYPVPDPALPFLGVHLTKRLDGGVLVGPNAVIALAREGYQRRTVRLRDVRDLLFYRGTWPFLRRHWRHGLTELSQSLSPHLFVKEARRFVPELHRDDVVPAPAGVRAQAISFDGDLDDDFRLGGYRKVTWVRNAPSPGATSCMAIAEELAWRAGLSRTRYMG